jgi:phage terminase small subunit
MNDHVKRLSPKMTAFVNEFVIDNNATRAAIRAGYSARTAQEQGSRLLSKVIVQKAVMKEREKAALRNEVTISEITQMHRRAFQVSEEAQQGSAMTGSAQNLAKLHGLIIEKSEVSTDITIEVVKYALADSTNKIEKEPIEHTGVDIKTIEFEVIEDNN